MALYGRVLSSENPLAAVSEPDNAGDSEQDNQDMMASVSGNVVLLQVNNWYGNFVVNSEWRSSSDVLIDSCAIWTRI